MRNENISPGYYKIGLTSDRGYSEALPGQFVTLKFADQIAPLLRRPFSIHRLITTAEGISGIEILYRVVGTCTKKLSLCKKGDTLDVLGPLGNGFSIPSDARRIFIAAGGIGVAPMAFLTSFMQKKGADLSECTVFIGGRSEDDILCRDDFTRMGIAVRLTTDDGSAGEKGQVTDILEPAMKLRPDIIYACGPMPMLKAVARVAKIYAVQCQISVETMMACGMGVCLGCAVEPENDSDAYMHVCKNGPVFDSDIIRI
ncbi:dihydroorotate dehydrogenase electron transfer subunit [Desulfococcaceae bacterium HSG8]|nr:dihydroorotate dehydrogenase electron transfer subunit [Desulfococcaceae bacterium HSG8]